MPNEMKDGVYVDVSGRSGTFFIGFYVQKKGIHTRWSTISPSTRSTQAEADAILIAKILHPGMVVYSDCMPAIDLEGGEYVPRSQNALAHRTARSRVNCIKRRTIKSMMENFMELLA